MNYYEHHLGDYAKDAGHLSMLEEGAYRRLLDAYYTRERPLPTDMRECCKLARAVSKQEREAVAYVLAEFFALDESGYRQRRADAEIARFQDKQRKARASAEARWAQSERNANASPNAMRTHSDGNADGMHRAPVPSHQSPVTKEKDKARASSVPPPRAPDAPDLEGHQPTPAGAVCRAMKAAGLQSVNPGDPRLLELLKQGATEAEFVGIAQEAVGKSKGFAWVLTVLQARRTEASAIALAPPAAPAETAYARKMREQYEVLAPSIAAQRPGAQRDPMTIDMEAANGPARLAE